ncbi:hypothetical protein HanIR_Chr12g0609561 [Helianthus annuus]|nr:hypothetical protein HanIR_Chr12g0609561 [Helianthus annuus]
MGVFFAVVRSGGEEWLVVAGIVNVGFCNREEYCGTLELFYFLVDLLYICKLEKR